MRRKVRAPAQPCGVRCWPQEQGIHCFPLRAQVITVHRLATSSGKAITAASLFTAVTGVGAEKHRNVVVVVRLLRLFFRRRRR